MGIKKSMTQPVYSSRTADKFVVRLSEGLRPVIASVAAENHRSMNSEIISRLEGSLQLEQENKDLQASNANLLTLNSYLLERVKALEAKVANVGLKLASNG